MSVFEDFMINEASEQTAELRRLHIENAKLRTAFKKFLDHFKENDMNVCGKSCEHLDCAETKVQVAEAEEALR